MIEDFKKSKYFNYLLENHKKIDKERIDFNDEIINLVSRQTDELGTILKCHLIIEFYIDAYLIASYPTIINWKETRLTFSQKLELIDNPKTVLGMYYSGIKNINGIRNKLSHRISYAIIPEDYKEIEKIMNVWYKALDKSLLTGIALIEDFTVWLCGNINMITKGIEEHSKTLGLPAYLQWLNEMQQDKNKC